MKKQLILLVSVLLGLASCSKYTVHSVKNENADFSGYRTFAWIYAGDSTNSFYKNDIAQDKLVDAVSAQLQSRGLSLNNRRPDVLIKYTAKVATEKQTYSEPVYYQPAPQFYGGFYRNNRYYYNYRRSFPVYVGEKERTYKYKEGTVVIDMIDRKTSKVVWRGWSEGEVTNAQDATNDITGVVNKIFDKYPVNAK